MFGDVLQELTDFYEQATEKVQEAEQKHQTMEELRAQLTTEMEAMPGRIAIGAVILFFGIYWVLIRRP